jgi:TPR repeat protein
MGVRVDDPMCHALLLEAAKQDHAKAMTHLAQHFLTGQGGVGAPDYKEGVRWLRKASTAGDKTAQFNLGNVYYHGQYAPQPSEHSNTRVTSAVVRLRTPDLPQNKTTIRTSSILTSLPIS